MKWEKMYANYMYYKALISEVYKELKQLNTTPKKKIKNKKERKKKKTKNSNQFKKQAKDLKRHFPRRHEWPAIYEKVLKITNYQGNTNQNHYEISIHTCSDYLLSKR